MISGESIRALAADLRRREVPSVSGVSWSANSVKTTVIRARNGELREHRGEVVHLARHRSPRGLGGSAPRC